MSPHDALTKWFSAEHASGMLTMLRNNGFVVVPREATDEMAGYAKHRNPEISADLAKGVWACMVSEYDQLRKQR